jgi:hypothetical protein
MIQSEKYGAQKVLIDDEDFDKIKGFKWSIYKYSYSNTLGVCTSRITIKSGRIPMSHIVLDRKPGFDVHFINRNPLDNRKENLILCTRSEHGVLHKGDSKVQHKREQKTNDKFICKSDFKYKSKIIDSPEGYVVYFVGRGNNFITEIYSSINDARERLEFERNREYELAKIKWYWGLRNSFFSP